jgi:hypothetical protein
LPSSYNKTPVTPNDQLRLRASVNSLSNSGSVSNLVAELVYTKQNNDSILQRLISQLLANTLGQATFYSLWVTPDT